MVSRVSYKVRGNINNPDDIPDHDRNCNMALGCCGGGDIFGFTLIVHNGI